MPLPGKKIALTTATLVFLAWSVTFFGPSSAVTVTDQFGGTALHQLAETFSFKRDFGKLKDLVQAGTVDLYQKDQLSFNFLHRLIYPLNTASQVTPTQFHEIVKFILKSGQKRLMEQPGTEVAIPILHMAVLVWELERKTLELFYKFSRKSFDTPDIHGRPVLFYAVKGNRSPTFFDDMVEVTGEELRFVTGHAGETLLHHAAELGTIKMVKFLIDEGLDVNQEDDVGQTPAFLAVRPQTEYLMELVVPKLMLLQKTGADLHHISKLLTNIWTYASIQSNVETLEYLLDNGFKVDEQGPEGLYPLQDIMTPRKSQLEFQYKLITKKAELLIKRGVDIYRIVNPKIQATYLHYAATVGPVDLVQLFVTEGLDPNAQTIQGQTPFHVIAQARYTDERESVLKKARILLDAGADMTIKDKQGTLPREALAKTLKSLGGEYTTVLDYIMEEGAELSRKVVDEVESYNQMKKETIASAASERENATKDEL